MVLSSQTPRAGASRQYMSSRPRNGIKWRWVAAIALVLASMYLFAWPDSDSGPTITNSAVQPATTQAGQPVDHDAYANAVGQANPGPTSTKEMSPPRELGAGSPPAPVVQTIGIAETKTTALANPNPPRTHNAQPPAHTGPTSAQATSQLTRGMSMIREGRLVQGRKELSQLLFAADDANLSPLDAQTVRDTLASVNKQLVFSDEIIPGDPIAESYLVQSGDYLSRIAPRYGIPYQFIERINRIKAERLQAGKPIKVIKGPFHARISKSDYRMDIYVLDPDGQPIYIRSFPVGLGKTDSTPNGAFIVTPNSKVTNPSWRNPRTGEFFAKNNPNIPIGEYWLALKGTDPNTESATGYGIHGTNDPSSIGRQASMGCIRMRDKDIGLVYDMLEGGTSTVQINW